MLIPWILSFIIREGTTINGEKCLLPFDANINDEYSFFPLRELYLCLEKIQKMKQVQNITIFMDVDFNNPAFEQNLAKLDFDKTGKKKKKKGKRKVKRSQLLKMK